MNPDIFSYIVGGFFSVIILMCLCIGIYLDKEKESK